MAERAIKRPGSLFQEVRSDGDIDLYGGNAAAREGREVLVTTVLKCALTALSSRNSGETSSSAEELHASSAVPPMTR